MEAGRRPSLQAKKLGPRCSPLTRRRGAKMTALKSKLTRRSKLIHDVEEAVWEDPQWAMTLNSIDWPPLLEELY